MNSLWYVHEAYGLDYNSGLHLPYPYFRKHKIPTAFDFFAGCGGFSLGFIQAGFEVVGGLEMDMSASHTYLANLGSYPIDLHFTSEQYKIKTEKYFERYFKSYKIKMGEIITPRVSGSGWIKSRNSERSREYFSKEKDPLYLPVKNFWIGDIREITGKQILDTLEMDFGELDVIMGGPPCQGFSKCNTKKLTEKQKDPRNNLVFEFARMIVEMQPKTFVMENVPNIVNMKTPEGNPILDVFNKILEDGEYTPLKEK